MYRVSAPQEEQGLRKEPPAKILQACFSKDSVRLLFNQTDSCYFAVVPLRGEGAIEMHKLGAKLSDELRTNSWLDADVAVAMWGWSIFDVGTAEGWKTHNLVRDPKGIVENVAPVALDGTVWRAWFENDNQSTLVLQAFDGRTRKFECPLPCERILATASGPRGLLFVGAHINRTSCVLAVIEHGIFRSKAVRLGRVDNLACACVSQTGIGIVAVEGRELQFHQWISPFDDNGEASWYCEHEVVRESTHLVSTATMLFAGAQTRDGFGVVVAFDGKRAHGMEVPHLQRVVVDAQDNVFLLRLEPGNHSLMLVLEALHVFREADTWTLVPGAKREVKVLPMLRPQLYARELALRDLATTCALTTGTVVPNSLRFAEIDDATTELRFQLLRNDELALHLRIRLQQSGACEAAIMRDFDLDGIPDDAEPEGVLQSFSNWIRGKSEGVLVKEDHPLVFATRLVEAIRLRAKPPATK